MTRVLPLLLCTLLLSGCGDTPQTQVRHWRFALEEIRGSVQDAYAQRFKALIEERSQGRVVVDVYPYGALGTSMQLTEQVQNGAIQFAFASPGHLGSVVPEAQVFSLHFLFSDDQAVNQALFARDERLHQLLGGAYRERGLELLAVVQEGWMVWTGNRPLRTPEDFNGFKMRTMVSPLLVEAYRAYGASPTPMPYAEVYSGLQLNMIDGQVNPVFAIEEMSFYEVQEVMTFARHLPFVATVIANPHFFQSLSEADRSLLAEVKAELDDYIFDLQARYNTDRLAKITEASGITVVELSDQERAAFRAASLPVRERYLAEAGPRGRAILDHIVASSEAVAASQSDTGAAASRP